MAGKRDRGTGEGTSGVISQRSARYMRRSMESESDLNIQMKNELKSKDLEIRSLSQQVLDLQREKSSISLADDTPSDVTVSGAESSVSSWNMRALRRTLRSEMNVNERMRVELKTKDDEIDQLSRQLHDLKDLRASESSIEEDVVGHHWSKDSDVTKSIEQVITPYVDIPAFTL